MAIDHQIALLVGDNDDWGLLTGLSQRRQQLPESRRAADPEMLQAAVQLMKLQRSAPRVSVCAGWDLVFCGVAGLLLRTPFGSMA